MVNLIFEVIQLTVTKYKFSSDNQVVFEGVTGSGALGDIALDDLSITYGRCMKIDYYGNR